MEETRCPICSAKMETWHDMLDGWCLLEDYIGCPNHCYSYYYYTGTTEITIMGKEFSYYHTASQKEKNKIHKQAHYAVQIFKVIYKIKSLTLLL